MNSGKGSFMNELRVLSSMDNRKNLLGNMKRKRNNSDSRTVVKTG